MKCLMRGGMCLVHDHREEQLAEVRTVLFDVGRRCAELREQRALDALFGEQPGEANDVAWWSDDTAAGQPESRKP